MHALHAGMAQQLDAIGDAVQFIENYATDASLYYQFGAFHTGRRRDIERRAVAAIVAARHFSDCISLGMKDIGLSVAGVVLTHVLKSRRSSVVTIGNDHAIFHYYGSYLSTLTIGIFCPDGGHSEIPAVEEMLFIN